MKLLKLVPDHTNVDFMRWRNLALVLSIIATVASISLHLLPRPQPRHRLRRRAGRSRRIRAAGPNRGPARPGRSRCGVGEASIQALGNDPHLPDPPAQAAGAGDRVERRSSQAARRDPAGNIPGARVDAGESVSGKVSEELAADSAKAIGFAMLGIAVYIWFRFEWQFGVGALRDARPTTSR